MKRTFTLAKFFVIVVLLMSMAKQTKSQCNLFNLNFTFSGVGGNGILFVPTANASTGNYTWHWNFGDGYTTSEVTTAVAGPNNQNHVYTKPGIYQVCLTVYRNSPPTFHCQVCKYVPIGINARKVDYSVMLIGNNVEFMTDVISSPSVMLQWDFGDGKMLTDTNQSIFSGNLVMHKYDNFGSYNVCLTTYDPTDGSFSQVCKDVIVDTGFVYNALFSYFVDTLNDKKVTFSDTSFGSVLNKYWTFGDGTFSTTLYDTITHVYANAGIYKVCLSASSMIGTNSQICKNMIIGNSSCNARYIPFINDTTVLFINASIADNTASWYWDFGDGTTSTMKNSVHHYAKAGFYNPSVSISDSSCYDYYTRSVQVGIDSTACKAYFKYHVPSIANNYVVFINKSLGKVKKYFWSFGDGKDTLVKYVNLPIFHKYEKAGVYNVCLIISDSLGNVDKYCETVQVGNIGCSALFTAFIDSLTNEVHFNNKVLGNSTNLYWDFGDGGTSTITNPTHKYIAPGYYHVTLTVEDSMNACMDKYSKLILIGNQGKDCEADFIYQVNEDTVLFFNQSIGDNLTNYLWYFGDTASGPQNISMQVNPLHKYTSNGYYNVCLTVFNAITKWKSINCKVVKVGDDTTQCYADFVYTVDSASNTVSFVDNSYGNPDIWLWNFSDSSTQLSLSPTMSHTFKAPGYYGVHLRIKNKKTQCFSDHIELINVGMGNNGLKGIFGYIIDTTFNNKGVYPTGFKGSSSGKPSSIIWTFGDGGTDTTTLEPTHTYTNPGLYNVCLTVADSTTQQSDTYCDSITIGMTEIRDLILKKITLINYPNPFSNYTNIICVLPEITEVDVSIYDFMGNRITTLINDLKNAGIYNFVWDSSNISSGIYFIRLSTKDETITKKMTIVK